MIAAGKAADLEVIVTAIALPAGVTIRAWDASDFPTIQQLSTAENWTTPIARAAEALEAWRHSWPALIAVHDEIVIGFSRSLSDGLVTTYVAEVLVAPAWRRQGIAAALLEATQRLFPGTRLDLLSTAEAGAFYQQAGFRHYAGFRLSWAERIAARRA